MVSITIGTVGVVALIGMARGTTGGPLPLGGTHLTSTIDTDGKAMRTIEGGRRMLTVGDETMGIIEGEIMMIISLGEAWHYPSLV